MMHTRFFQRLLPAVLLALGMVTLTPLSSPGQNAAPPGDRAKTIAELEKQLADIQARLKALKDGDRETLPTPRVLVEGGLPQAWADELAWRSIGPATMGGRITALAVAADDPSTYWVATGGGGLLKTANNGITFEHQFDHETTVSIGAVAVAPSNKNVVWVGTGENNPRNSVSFGDGVYKSEDGGKTWKNMGLKESYQVGAIVIHPKDPNTVYVGALGRLYGPNPERGLFKTTDGGKTWARVHHVDDRTGVIDIVMHPTDPETLLVATWERQRDGFDSFRGPAKPPEATDVYGPSRVHGPGSGIWKTTDGGKTFRKLAKGLPTVPLGRIGLDYSRKNPNTVFAVVDTADSGKGTPPVVPYLGVTGEDVKEGGARVTAVTEGGPAAKAGFQAGDVVLTFAGKPVKNYAGLVELLRTLKPGEAVKVEVLRGKDKKDLTATPGTRPAPGGGNQRPSLGVQVEEAEGGLRVDEVVENGPAAKAGLKEEDLIIAVDGNPVENQRSIFRLVGPKKAGERVKVTYLRGKERKDVDVTLDVLPPGRPGRPYSGGMLAGQQPNVQDKQGPDGWQTGGVYKSTDGGESWARVNSLNERPFYFSVVRVDPTDENVLWLAGVNLWHSKDGGKNFNGDGVNGGLHSDQHAIWVDPKDGRHMLVGTDGGYYVTYDGAAHWQHLNKLALGQFYHVDVDSRRPYRVYGGLQDNGSWGGPSQTPRALGPINEDWRYVNGGDGFVCRVDPSDPDTVYAESQDGFMMRRNMKTGDSHFIRPRAAAGLGAYRWNWNTPFVLSHHNPRIFYCAGNYVFRSVKQGEDLKAISPEITRTKRGSGTALGESPRNPDVLWAGTDDGAVWVTRDGGRNWADVTPKLLAAGLPGPRWVASLEPSRQADGRCYAVFDGHRSDDDQPHVYATEDFGQTWASLRANLPAGPTRVLREDVTRPELLYLGTEFSVYASINRGGSWTRVNGRPRTGPAGAAPGRRQAANDPRVAGSPLPTVAVHEIAQPTAASEIVAATHGRSVWVLDVTALRQMTAEVARATKPALFAPAPAIRWVAQPGRQVPFSESQRKFIGQNPPAGVVFEYVLPAKASKAALKVLDIAGKTVRDLQGPATPGYHRVGWDLRRSTPIRPGAVAGGASEAEIAASPFGRLLLGQEVLPGQYRVVLTVDGQEYTQSLTVEPDPTAPPEALTATDEAEEMLDIRRALRRERQSMSADDDEDDD